MIFGSQRDFNLLIKINRELLSDVIEQEILYYKMSLEETQANIYGEAQEKVFWSPVKVNCLIDRGEPGMSVDDFGPDRGRTTSFRFLTGVQDGTIEENFSRIQGFNFTTGLAYETKVSKK